LNSVNDRPSSTCHIRFGVKADLTQRAAGGKIEADFFAI
jgi:hypothetical protein